MCACLLAQHFRGRMTQICIEGANGSVENGNDMDPRYSPEVIDERGLFDLPNDGLVSSLALTPDGCYVFAGFGGGEVRMYAQALRTVGAASRSGTIVAQIKSKVSGRVQHRGSGFHYSQEKSRNCVRKSTMNPKARELP